MTVIIGEYFPKQRLLLVKEKMYQDKILNSCIWVSLELYMATHSSTLAWKIPWTEEGAWWATVHRVAKCRTQLSDFTFTFHSHALETEMATHSSVLAWRIPGTEEPGGLLSMGLHRLRHNWSDLAAAAELYRNLLLLWWFCYCSYFVFALSWEMNGMLKTDFSKKAIKCQYHCKYISGALYFRFLRFQYLNYKCQWNVG